MGPLTYCFFAKKRVQNSQVGDLAKKKNIKIVCLSHQQHEQHEGPRVDPSHVLQQVEEAGDEEERNQDLEKNYTFMWEIR